jgi:hypothetical protein
MMKLKTATPIILLGALIGLLGIYLISGICNDFDIDFDLGTYLDENWNTTQKRPYNLHGLDD